MSDDDRCTILRRRAFFVTSAVAAFGACARTPPAEPTSPAPVVSVPLAVEDAGEPPEDTAPPARDASPSAEGAPPLLVPAGVSDTARGNYERLVRTMTRAYGVLDEIDAAMPGCPVLSPKCVPRWRDVAEKLHELDGMFQRLFVCHGSSPEAKTYADIEQAHQQHYGKRRARIQEQLDALLERGGDPARARWEELKRDAFQAAPHPCLKFACPDW
jgi:hypothetical protein